MELIIKIFVLSVAAALWVFTTYNVIRIIELIIEEIKDFRRKY